MRFLALLLCLLSLALASSDDAGFTSLHLSLFPKQSKPSRGHPRKIPESAVSRGLRTRFHDSHSVSRPGSSYSRRRQMLARQMAPVPSIGPMPMPPTGSGDFPPLFSGELFPESSPSGALFCTADSDCGGDFICVPEAVPGLGFCAKDDFCFCIPLPPPKCNASDMCDKGETCVFLNPAYNLCVRDTVVSSSKHLTPIYISPEFSPGLEPEISPGLEPEISLGPQALFCESDPDCSSGICIPEGEQGLGFCGPGKFCFCTTTSWTTSCVSGAECSGTDVCAVVNVALRFCVDEQVFQESSQLFRLPDIPPESSPSVDSETSVFCESDFECGGGICIFANGTFATPCSKQDLGPCFCLQVLPTYCSVFLPCQAQDEVCVTLSSAFTVCISELVTNSSDPMGPLLSPIPEPLPTDEVVEETPSISGPPALFCDDDSDCPDWCIPEGLSRLGVCNAGEFCFCIPIPPAQCVSGSQCGEGEVCAILNGKNSICVNEEVFNSSSQLLKVPDSVPVESSPVIGSNSIFCKKNSDCGAGICITSNGTFVEPCVGKESCFCLALPLRSCGVVSSCGVGEFCTDLSGFLTVCLPEIVVDTFDILKPRPEASPEPFLIEVTLEPEFTPESDFLFGLTGGSCGFDFVCIGERSCMELKQLDMPCLRNGRCICVPPELTFCASSTVCVPGEVCAESSAGGNAVCVSERIVEAIDDFKEVTL